MLLRSLIASALLVCLAACSSGDGPRPVGGDTPETTTSAVESVDAHQSLAVGAEAAFKVYAHCGFEFTEIDGELWKTRLRDDGQGNPPAGWTDVVEGTVERTSQTRAVFIGSSVQVRAVFRPAPGAKYACD